MTSHIRLLPFIFVGLSAITMASCKKKSTEYRIPEFPPTSIFDSVVDMTPAYAKGFKVRYLSDGTPLIDIVCANLGSSTDVDTFRLALLRQAGSSDIPENYHRLTVPVRSVVCTDSRQISYFIGLDSLSLVKGVPGDRTQHTEVVGNMMSDGEIEQTGKENMPDMNTIRRLAPDVVLVSPLLYFDKTFQKSNLTWIPIFSEFEDHPLGQTEWIKLIALLIGKEESGSDFFGKAEQNYNDAKVSTLEVALHPPLRLVVNRSRELGKEHFQNQFITDAGGQVSQRITKSLIFVSTDRDIKSFEETATVAPDAVLKDVISLIHPEVIPQDSVWKRQFFTEIVK